MGRKALYTPEEKKQKQREHSLKHYYRKKALQEQLSANNDAIDANATEITVQVANYSKKLGNIEEAITYKTTNGKLRKKQDIKESKADEVCSREFSIPSAD